MVYISSLVLLVSVPLSLCVHIKAYEYPFPAYLVLEEEETIESNPALYAVQFNTSANFRQMFCDLQEKYNRKETELRDAMKGQSIHVSLGPDYLNFRRDGRSIDANDPGLYVTLMDE